jgi:tetratricopeptide (TPR) repeat protein
MNRILNFFGASLLAISLLAAILLLAWSEPAQAQAQEGRSMRDEGIRYIKLAGTYREAQNYDLALKYATKGLQMVTNLGSQYWEAASYETLGLIYRDMGDRQSALSYLRRSSDIFNRIIRQKDGSAAAVNMLIDDIEQGADRNELLRNELQQKQELNRQLNDRVASLEERIRQLEASRASAAQREAAAQREDFNALPENKPQEQFAPYSVDKKRQPAPPPPPPRRTTETRVVPPPPLPTLVLQLGAGMRYNLNSTVANPGPFKFPPMLILSADYFVTPALSVGVVGGIDLLTTPVTESTTASVTTPTATQPLTDPVRTQFVGIRAAYHPLRTQELDVYTGISGAVVWPTRGFNWMAGVLLGVQYNFTPVVGVFLDGTLGAASNYNDAPLNATQVLGFGAHARLGLSFSF